MTETERERECTREEGIVRPQRFRISPPLDLLRVEIHVVISIDDDCGGVSTFFDICGTDLIWGGATC